jgi:hypothetical protein
LLQTLERFSNEILDKYIIYSNKIAKTAVETNPEAFLLLDQKNIKIVHAEFNLDFFHSTRGHTLLFIRSNNADKSFISINFLDESLYEESYLKSEETIKHELVANYLNIEPSNIIHSVGIGKQEIQYMCQSEEKFQNELRILENAYIKSWVIRDAKSFQTHVNQPMDYYAKNASRYSYSILDLQPIIEKVNNRDFEYQLDQAIAAYDNSLYLASCATLGVCLETLCKLLLQKNKVKIKDSDGTMLDKLSEMLRSHQIISYKFNSRINVCYQVRNLASHTSPGKIVQNDCHFIINTIHEIVDTYF